MRNHANYIRLCSRLGIFNYEKIEQKFIKISIEAWRLISYGPVINHLEELKMETTLWLGMPVWIWVEFIAIVLAVLAFDLGVMHREAHEIGVRESLSMSAPFDTQPPSDLRCDVPVGYATLNSL